LGVQDVKKSGRGKGRVYKGSGRVNSHSLGEKCRIG